MVGVGTAVQGLININTASKKVLEMIPGLTAEDITKLTSYRTQQGADLSTLGWLADALTSAEQPQAAVQKLQQIVPFLTTRAYQFRFDVVARIRPRSQRESTSTAVKTLDPSAAPPPARVMRRLTVIYDKTAGRIVYARDITRPGQPYPIEEPAE